MMTCDNLIRNSGHGQICTTNMPKDHSPPTFALLFDNSSSYLDPSADSTHSQAK